MTGIAQPCRRPHIVDGHVHVFGDSSYPLSGARQYEAHPSQRGTARQLEAVLDAHGVGYALLVAAQPYGFDNRCMLDAIEGSRGRFKGIALVDPSREPGAWRQLADAGVVGLRVNLSSFGQEELRHPDAGRLFGFAREAGWFLQVHCIGDDFAEAAPLLRATGLRLMIDHFGRPDVGLGVQQPGFRALLEYGRSGDAIVKLSGPFRSSREGPSYCDVDPYVEAAIEAFTLDNCIWGSDWPFVPWKERVDYGPVFAALRRWLPAEEDRRRILWDNPSRLFGFA